MPLFKRIVVMVVMAFIVVAFGIFVLNFYLAWRAASEPPAIIFERTDRPSRV